MPHYRIEYYNKLWKDWAYFDQNFYRTEEQARKAADDYKQSVPNFQTRITQTTILDEKPRTARTKDIRRVNVEKL